MWVKVKHDILGIERKRERSWQLQQQTLAHCIIIPVYPNDNSNLFLRLSFFLDIFFHSLALHFTHSHCRSGIERESALDIHGEKVLVFLFKIKFTINTVYNNEDKWCNVSLQFIYMVVWISTIFENKSIV